MTEELEVIITPLTWTVDITDAFLDDVEVIIEPSSTYSVTVETTDEVDVDILEEGQITDIDISESDEVVNLTDSSIQVFLDSENQIVEFEDEPAIEITNMGEQGPPGIQGPQGIIGEVVRYVHTQSSPSAEWTINHNLNGDVVVSLRTSGGVEFDAEVIKITSNQVKVFLTYPMTGYVVCI